VELVRGIHRADPSKAGRAVKPSSRSFFSTVAIYPLTTLALSGPRLSARVQSFPSTELRAANGTFVGLAS
jgi:hypothetical protein